jgi:HAE1 family hydrophobic/amphiphilic exporter-1
VEVAGQQKPSVRIQVDPVKVASFGLSLEDLRGLRLASASNSAA